MEDSLYRISLRILGLTLACVLAFESGLFSPVTKQLSDDTRLYLANSVGMFASIEPNELNVITARLTERERELDAREREIAAREMDTGSNGSATTTFILSAFLFILLVLIVLNYVLDFLRARQEAYYEQAV
jgi:hypothetical protein